MDGAPQHYCLEDLAVGMSASLSRRISTEDAIAFARLTGDNNPIHLDEAYAARSTPFGGCVAHGMLTAGLLSALFGARFPGPGSIYLSQALRFRAPVRLGSDVMATVRVTAIDAETGRVTFDCVCRVGDEVVLDGEAVLLVPKRS